MSDSAASGIQALTVRRLISAPRELIFRAWTDPEQLKKWFGPSDAVTIPSAIVDFREGGSYRITMIGPQKVPFVVRGVYREIRPHDKLVFTWIWEDADLDMGETLVTVDLNEQGAATEVVLTHELFPNADSRGRHAEGWEGSLGKLAAYLARNE